MASSLSMLSFLLDSFDFGSDNQDVTSSELQEHGEKEPEGFFRLPLELREEIYKYALPHSSQSGRTFRASGSNSDIFADPEVRQTPNHVYTWQRGNIGLLAVNHQMNFEARRIFWSTNIFNIVIDSAHPVLVIRYPNEAASKLESSASRRSWGSLKRPVILFTSSKAMKELREVPRARLSHINHVYMVIRRSSDYTYEPDMTAAMNKALKRKPRTDRDSASAESIKRNFSHTLFAQKHDILSRGLFTAFKALNMIPPATKPEHWDGRGLRKQKCAVRDIELVIYPTRHLYKENIVEVDTNLRTNAEYCIQSCLAKNAYKIAALKPYFDYNYDPWSFSSKGPRSMGRSFASALVGFEVESSLEGKDGDDGPGRTTG
jgi:hypothetical protein